MSKQTLHILLVVIIIVVGAISYDMIRGPKENHVQSQLSATPTSQYLPQTVPQTTLWLQPNPATVTNDGSVDLDMYINAQENKVTAVQLEISYDPTALQYVSIKGTDLLAGRPELIKRIDEKNGRITFAAGVAPQDKNFSIQGADEIGKLVFRKLRTNETQTEVKLLPVSLVTARGVEQSVMTQAKGTIVNLSQ